MALLFCNVGWMERYQGLGFGDQISGGGAYVNEEGRGHEVCNFTNVNGVLYGFVQTPGQQINIERLGAKATDDHISGITVVWTATRPTGGTAVIGWYKDATIYRDYQKYATQPRSQKQNGIDGYWIKANTSESKLLGVDERTCEIPRQVKGGMGQSNIWYADGPDSALIRTRVMQLLKGERATPTVKKNPSKQQDQERKALIEKTAIRICCNHFESLGYTVTSVEKDNVGWDLVAASGKTFLQIEVKGLSGSDPFIELTPNEYRAFSAQSDGYRLAILTSALKEPKLLICRYSAEQKKWVVEGHGSGHVEIQIKQSASIRCS